MIYEIALFFSYLYKTELCIPYNVCVYFEIQHSCDTKIISEWIYLIFLPRILQACRFAPLSSSVIFIDTIHHECYFNIFISYGIFQSDMLKPVLTRNFKLVVICNHVPGGHIKAFIIAKCVLHTHMAHCTAFSTINSSQFTSLNMIWTSIRPVRLYKTSLIRFHYSAFK